MQTSTGRKEPMVVAPIHGKGVGGASPQPLAHDGDARDAQSNVRLQPVVRYGSRMVMGKVTSLRVVLVEEGKRETRGSSVNGMLGSPMITVAPLIPGAQVTPPTMEIAAAAGSEAHFSVVPLCRGRLANARVELRQGHRTLGAVPLKTKAVGRRLVWFLLLLTLVVPSLLAYVKTTGWRPKIVVLEKHPNPRAWLIAHGVDPEADPDSVPALSTLKPVDASRAGQPLMGRRKGAPAPTNDAAKDDAKKEENKPKDDAKKEESKPKDDAKKEESKPKDEQSQKDEKKTDPPAGKEADKAKDEKKDEAAKADVKKDDEDPELRGPVAIDLSKVGQRQTPGGELQRSAQEQQQPRGGGRRQGGAAPGGQGGGQRQGQGPRGQGGQGGQGGGARPPSGAGGMTLPPPPPLVEQVPLVPTHYHGEDAIDKWMKREGKAVNEKWASDSWLESMNAGDFVILGTTWVYDKAVPGEYVVRGVTFLNDKFTDGPQPEEERELAIQKNAQTSIVIWAYKIVDLMRLTPFSDIALLVVLVVATATAWILLGAATATKRGAAFMASA